MVTILHEFGHFFFAKLFGGRVIVHIGTGNVLFKIGSIRIRKLYFYDGWCEYVSVSRGARKVEKVLVYLGGSLFNIISILVLNGLIMKEFPINHLNGCPSDGMAALNVLTNKKFDKNPPN
jgi:hypothetical protein